MNYNKTRILITTKDMESKTLQQTWPMVTKSSEENVFCNQIVTFNEEIKNLSPNIKKYIKMVTKPYFRHKKLLQLVTKLPFVTVGHGKY